MKTYRVTGYMKVRIEIDRIVKAENDSEAHDYVCCCDTNEDIFETDLQIEEIHDSRGSE